MDQKTIINELNFKTARSSGPGGQNVNKVSSKVILIFNINESNGLSQVEKTRLTKKLSSKLTADGVLNLSCEETRSQFKNKELAIKKLFSTLKESLIIPKKRISTKPTKASKKRKLDSKKHRGAIKSLRKNPKVD